MIFFLFLFSFSKPVSFSLSQKGNKKKKKQESTGRIDHLNDGLTYGFKPIEKNKYSIRAGQIKSKTLRLILRRVCAIRIKNKEKEESTVHTHLHFQVV